MLAREKSQTYGAAGPAMEGMQWMELTTPSALKASTAASGTSSISWESSKDDRRTRPLSDGATAQGVIRATAPSNASVEGLPDRTDPSVE